MKDLSIKYVLSFIAIILLLGACNFPSQSPEPEVDATIEIIPTSTPSNLETYTSEEYSFTYPKEYTINLPIPGFPVLNVEKARNQRMEIFQMSDFPGRPFGFTGEETQEEIDGYLPKEKLTVGSGENQYDIWLFYSEGDQETIDELHAILESIEIKQ